MANHNIGLRGGLGQSRLNTLMFSGVVSFSALLVFFVEPMAGKLILPRLGGAPAVWNTALAFFQLDLLAGYAYAHLLQKWASNLKVQWGVHLAVLVLAAFTLPLHLTGLVGAPIPNHSISWVLEVLTLSVGGPFFALSATAPLAQAWFSKIDAARTPAAVGADETARPAPIYALYAASNLGSLAALISYPTVIEPLSDLTWQRWAWSLGFVGFAILMGFLGFKVWSANAASDAEPAKTPVSPIAATPSLMQILKWIALAAAPSSLLMGVSTHLATDVATAPLLWVAPLALYLLTFVIAFSARRWVKTETLLAFQAAALLACMFTFLWTDVPIGQQIGLHLGCFFLTSWMCHQALADDRPDPSHLTLYYLCMSFGGVVGGSFNAFVAPLIFNRVYEYPAVLVLANLARPWKGVRLTRKEAAMFVLTLGLFCAIPLLQRFGQSVSVLVALALLGAPTILAFLMRDRALYFATLISVLLINFYESPTIMGQTGRVLASQRSFFGVTKVSEVTTPDLGVVRVMMSGTTIHGAEAASNAVQCLPLTYYGPKTGIGRTVLLEQARHPALALGVIGLGAGALASYVRPQDHLTYYEIDPLVAQFASDPHWFHYLAKCSHGATQIRLGDGRLNLKSDLAARYDLLVVDAFSSDSVPTHLLTTEAVKLAFARLSPDGVVLFHITNRNLALASPLMATIRAAGGVALYNHYKAPHGVSFQNLSTEVIVASPNIQSLATFHNEPGFQELEPRRVRAWTDSYTNLIGAIFARHL